MRELLKRGIEKVLAQEIIGRCDFHTHSFFSDGVLLPMEQLRRAHVFGHQVYAITDHISASNLDIITKLHKDCMLALKHWGIIALPGVEITHVPKDAIEEVAQKAMEMGALIIVVHGETTSEPVEPGTNLKAAKLPIIDILAHPGMFTKEEAKYCKRNNVFVEITSHKNHSKTNEIVARVGKEEKVDFIQNTDTHMPNDMLKYKQAKKLLHNIGFNEEASLNILQKNVRKLLNAVYEKL